MFEDELIYLWAELITYYVSPCLVTVSWNLWVKLTAHLSIGPQTLALDTSLDTEVNP